MAVQPPCRASHAEMQAGPRKFHADHLSALKALRLINLWKTGNVRSKSYAFYLPTMNDLESESIENQD
jgi:hypothetical protein